MPIFSNPPLLAATLGELRSSAADRLARHWRGGTLLLALLFCLITALGARAQRRQSGDLADLFEICLAMDQWRENPAGRLDQLPRLHALFQRQSALLDRFGGTFLQVAGAQEGGKSPKWAAERFAEQQKRWSNSPDALRRDFETATLASARRDWSKAAQLTLPKAGDSGHSVQLQTAEAELRAWHSMRALSAAALAQNAPDSQRALAALRAAGQVSELGRGRAWAPPYRDFFAQVTSGQLTFTDWVDALDQSTLPK